MMKKTLFLAGALLSVVACSDEPVGPTVPATVVANGPNLAASAATESDVFPFALAEFVPCANGGVGEIVEASGRLHEVLTSVLNADGRLMLRSHFQPQDVSGVGVTTGTKYQATGVTDVSAVLAPPFPVASTFVNNFRLIGAGPGNNLLVHEVAHVTIDANGTIRVDFDKPSIECH